jgi:hypothetical protein
MFPKRLSLSEACSNLTLRGFDAKSRCRISNEFHVLPSVGCLNTRLLSAHECATSCNNTLSHKQPLQSWYQWRPPQHFTCRLFDVLDDSSSYIISRVLPLWFFTHCTYINFSLSLKNCIQSLQQARIFSFQSFKCLKYFLTSYAFLGKVPFVGTVQDIFGIFHICPYSRVLL